MSAIKWQTYVGYFDRGHYEVSKLKLAWIYPKMVPVYPLVVVSPTNRSFAFFSILKLDIFVIFILRTLDIDNMSRENVDFVYVFLLKTSDKGSLYLFYSAEVQTLRLFLDTKCLYLCNMHSGSVFHKCKNICLYKMWQKIIKPSPN